MDGLELMSKVRDILPFTVFIILTNYAEFSYAKQAISLGAREYILKSEMRSSDIQRIVAEIAATTAKIRSEKVHDVLQDGVVDLYEMYRNFEQPGAVAAFWQRQGLRPGPRSVLHPVHEALRARGLVLYAALCIAFALAAAWQGA